MNTMALRRWWVCLGLALGASIPAGLLGAVLTIHFRGVEWLRPWEIPAEVRPWADELFERYQQGEVIEVVRVPVECMGGEIEVHIVEDQPSATYGFARRQPRVGPVWLEVSGEVEIRNYGRDFLWVALFKSSDQPQPAGDGEAQ